MLRLVESPPGHLAGSLVVSSLNKDGSRKADWTCDVIGTITGSNVSLQLQRSPLAHWFGVSTNLVGSLHDRTLTLSLGNQTEIFHESSQMEYEAALASLNELGQHIGTVVQAKNALLQAHSDGRQLNADLKSYIDWGQQRIAHVRNVRQWYAYRINGYTRCLQTIRPLAAAGVPSWRWQNCVLTIENDAYNREQETTAIGNLQSQNQQTVASLKARIAAARRQFGKAVRALNAACPYMGDLPGPDRVNECRKGVALLRSHLNNGFLDGQLISEFQKTAPQVSTAIIADARVSGQDAPILSSLAEQTEGLYRSAR